MTLQKKCSGSEDGKLTDRNKRSTEKIETIKEATLFFSKVTGKEVILKKWRLKTCTNVDNVYKGRIKTVIKS